MNTQLPNSNPPSTVAAIGGGSEEMAIHFGLMDCHASRAGLRADDSFLFHALARSFRVLLAEVFARDPGHDAAGDFINGLIRFDAPNRVRVLNLSLNHFKPYTVAMEFARYHTAEDHWIIMHPAGAQAPFVRWLTKESSADRYRRTDALLKAMEKVSLNLSRPADTADTADEGPQ